MARGKTGQRSGLLERIAELPPSQRSKAENEARWKEAEFAMSFDGKLAEAKRLVAEIEVYAEERNKELGYEFGQPFAADDELSFVVNALAKVTSARSSLQVAEANRDDFTVTAFLNAFRLLEARQDLEKEFDHGDLIAPTLSQIPGRSAGGVKRGKELTAVRRPEWKRWQDCADEIWKISPGLPASQVARTVKKRLRLDDAVRTIRQRIKELAST